MYVKKQKVKVDEVGEEEVVEAEVEVGEVAGEVVLASVKDGRKVEVAGVVAEEVRAVGAAVVAVDQNINLE